MSNSKKKILLIAGPSGCGKNYITEKLIEKYPHVFFQYPQYTTRPKRTPDENTYTFVTDEEYDLISERLIAHTEVNGYRYGTLLSEPYGISIFGIVIVNKLGIENIRSSYDRNKYELVFLGIDSSIPQKREDRGEEYVKAEREGLYEMIPAEKWLVNSEENGYITPEDVLTILAINDDIISAIPKEHSVKSTIDKMKINK